MTQTLFNNYQKWFEQYTDQHTMSDAQDQRNIDLKIEHTQGVVKVMTDICAHLALANNDTLLAQTMALFHDLGRFPQYKSYKTFKDSASKNHAALSVAELKQQAILSALPQEEQALILTSITHHNALKLPKNLSKRERLFAELLRDADKVDILYTVTNYYANKHEVQNKTIELDLGDAKEFTSDILAHFLHGEAIIYDDMKVSNDFKLLQLGWVNDLNFSRSLELIVAGHYFQKIIDTIPESASKDQISAYMQQRISEGLNKQEARM